MHRRQLIESIKKKTERITLREVKKELEFVEKLLAVETAWKDYQALKTLPQFLPHSIGIFLKESRLYIGQFPSNPEIEKEAVALCAIDYLHWDSKNTYPQDFLGLTIAPLKVYQYHTNTLFNVEDLKKRIDSVIATYRSSTEKILKQLVERLTDVIEWQYYSDEQTQIQLLSPLRKILNTEEAATTTELRKHIMKLLYTASWRQELAGYLANAAKRINDLVIQQQG